MLESLFFKKVAGQLIKKEALAQVFSCEFWEIYKNTSGQLLLKIDNFDSAYFEMRMFCLLFLSYSCLSDSLVSFFPISNFLDVLFHI